MSYTTSEMTPADFAAVCGNRNNDGFGFGGDGAWWIIILLLFGWGGRGFGFGGNGAGYSGGGGVPATQADLAAGFNNSAVLSGINGIDSALCQGFNGINTSLLQGFNGVERGFFDISRQFSDCCCTTQRAIDGVNYNMAKGFCDLGNVINNTTRDVIENANANSRAILDFLTKDKIDTLQSENLALRFRASQSEQNAFITANQQAQTAELIRRLGADCPTPAYVVQPPQPVTFPTNCCGQAQYANYGNNACGGF